MSSDGVRDRRRRVIETLGTVRRGKTVTITQRKTVGCRREGECLTQRDTFDVSTIEKRKCEK